MIAERFAVRAVLRERSATRIAEQEVGEVVAGDAAVESVIAVLVADKKRNLILVTIPAEFKPEFECMRSFDPGKIVAELENAIDNVARMAWRADAAKEAGDLEFRHAAQAVLRRAWQTDDAEGVDDLVALFGERIIVKSVITERVAGAEFVDQVRADDPVVRAGEIPQRRG